VIRAHGRIYRADAQGSQRIRNFYLREFPRTFRRNWIYTAVAFSVFMLFSVIGFAGSYRDPDFSELMGVSPAFRELAIETKTHWWEDLNEANQVGASSILTHNIQVTIYTFAFGALFGVGTLFFLAYNGANVFLSLDEYRHVGRWVKELTSRPATRRGMLVNRAMGGEEGTFLRERHDASDFDTLKPGTL